MITLHPPFNLTLSHAASVRPCGLSNRKWMLARVGRDVDREVHR